MSEIKVDLSNKSLTIETRRSLTGFNVDAIEKTVEVNYRELQYTGTIGEEDYLEISNIIKSYDSDFESWLSSQAGKDIQAAIEENLAKDVPGT